MIPTPSPLPAAVLSPGEERFERIRQRAGVVLAPAGFVVLLLLPLPGLSPEAHRLAAVMAAVMILWISEALPLPVTALLSGWISNTATTAMMFGIGLFILRFLLAERHDGRPVVDPGYATGLMLMTAFAASIGGLATPIGTPPNVIGIGFMRQLLGVELSFFKWMVVGAPVAALLGALLLFVLPGEAGRRAITWEAAVRIDWGVVLLYGGGFALGVLSFQTGLAEAVGRGLTRLVPGSGAFSMLAASVAVATLLSEATSNTASANMVVRVVISMAQAASIDPFLPALGATLGASLGFMLPVSTPCNAIVYGSGYIPLMRMVRCGILLDLVGIVVIVGAVSLLGPLLR